MIFYPGRWGEGFYKTWNSTLRSGLCSKPTTSSGGSRRKRWEEHKTWGPPGEAFLLFPGMCSSCSIFLWNVEIRSPFGLNVSGWPANFWKNVFDGVSNTIRPWKFHHDLVLQTCLSCADKVEAAADERDRLKLEAFEQREEMLRPIAKWRTTRLRESNVWWGQSVINMEKVWKGSLYSVDVDACGCAISVWFSLCRSGRFFPDETFSLTGVMEILS